MWLSVFTYWLGSTALQVQGRMPSHSGCIWVAIYRFEFECLVKQQTTKLELDPTQLNRLVKKKKPGWPQGPVNCLASSKRKWSAQMLLLTLTLGYLCFSPLTSVPCIGWGSRQEGTCTVQLPGGHDTPQERWHWSFCSRWRYHEISRQHHSEGMNKLWLENETTQVFKISLYWNKWLVVCGHTGTMFRFTTPGQNTLSFEKGFISFGICKNNVQQQLWGILDSTGCKIPRTVDPQIT